MLRFVDNIDTCIPTFIGLIFPYRAQTQDVFVGSKTSQYDDGRTVHHVGADNTMAALQWVFTNFPNPSHIVLTGCSAGGTALPIAYDLLNKHYNRWTRSPPGMRSVQISIMADSPVYLTPSYFLENALDQWDPSPIMKKIRFPFEEYRYDEDYSTKVWEHVLRRGPNADQWGFVTHSDDPVSQTYFSYMGGMYGDGDGDGDEDGGAGRRQLEDQDLSELWWSSLSSSISFVQQTHSNVDTFIIDSEGHCSFGLYYALQEGGDAFDDWAESIIREKAILGRTLFSIPLFFASIALGSILSAGTIFFQRRRREVVLDDVVLLNDAMKTRKEWVRSSLATLTSFLRHFEAHPISAGYSLAITFYFVGMLVSGGFAHPIDNPSLGPSALTLSEFGINNPTLIVYKSQLFRLITSTFLCSGILSYAIVLFCIYRHTRYIEMVLGSASKFITLCATLSFGCNLFYACLAQGASCSSISFILSLNVFSIVLGRRCSCIDTDAERSFPRPIASTVTFMVLSSLLFPFNSWIMLLGGAITSGVIGFMMLEVNDSGVSTCDGKEPTCRVKIRMQQCILVTGTYLVMVLLLGLRIIRPSEIYSSPFLTGCDLVYTEVSSDFSSSFYDSNKNDGQNLRWLDDGASSGNICAEFCVPHLFSRTLQWGANKYTGYSVEQGQCADNGYGTHVADKTFSKATYSVDVEVYSS